MCSRSVSKKRTWLPDAVMFVLVGTVVPRLFETETGNLLPAFSVPVTEVEEVGLATGTVVVTSVLLVTSVSAKEVVVSDVIEAVGVEAVTTVRKLLEDDDPSLAAAVLNDRRLLAVGSKPAQSRSNIAEEDLW